MSNEFLTKDLYFASFLYCKAVRFEGVERVGSVCWFSFAPKEECEKLQRDFFAKEAVVNAKEFVDSLRTLKDLVFTNKN